MARFSEQERENAVELMPAEGDETGNPGDAAENWSDFEALREQGESDRRGMFIWVYRIPTDGQGIPVTGGETSLLFAVPIDTYPSLPAIFNRVKKEYMPRGAGRTLIRIQVRKEKRSGVLWQKVFPIEKGTQDDEPEIVSAKGNDGLGEIARVIQQAMAAQAEQNRALIGTLIARQNAAPPVDNLAQTERMITMVTGLAGILVNKNAGSVTAGASVAEQLSGFREMMKFAKEMNGGGGGDYEEEPGALGVVKALTPWAPIFEKLIGKMETPALPADPPRQVAPVPRPRPSPEEIARRDQVRAQAQARARPTRPAAQPEPPRARPAEPKPQGDHAMLMKIVEMTNDLIALKNNGADAGVVGRSITEIVTPEIEERLLTMLDSADWFAKLAGFNPAVREHEEFFTKVRDAFLEEFPIDENADDVTDENI